MDKLTYKSAGVDVEAGYKAVRLMKDHVKKTHIPGVMGDLGSFGGFFMPDLAGYKEPVFVSGTDGVGTKLQLAFMMDKHDTIGVDCVAMCVNDIVCHGAKPLFFLDYIGTGRLNPVKAADIVKGISAGCMEAGCALIGGETAEMPGFYNDEEYDLAGFAVGLVDKEKVINGDKVKAGDIIIGLSSNGIHSNGYSLVRKLFFEMNDFKVDSVFSELADTLGEELLKPTKIYVKTVHELLKKIRINGIAHITGGGLIENIPRTIPKKNLKAKINLGSWPVLPIFNLIKDLGNMEEQALYNTFNMGIGLIIIVDKDIAGEAMKHLETLGEKAYTIGEVVPGEGGIEFCKE